MHVLAAPGHQVPMESDPHNHIDPTESVDVPDTSYYRRRMAAGELLPAKKPRNGAKQPAQEPAE
ncbi:DUF2635 domain-containing protein [Pseudomonas frederiksbergensis]|uniref:DUF2635 domain-containing protein n=1 Tax=Pseudomonas frederiksbergensis TaxID=104087 RepID=A0A1J0EK49_9PSED|nr:DUF2635 domain-containing protein [Pseudomonas frederiksbergensis]APC16291.1 DUF2635 domain-containing protein [Pseudomonas frederiksbergensis]